MVSSGRRHVVRGICQPSAPPPALITRAYRVARERACRFHCCCMNLNNNVCALRHLAGVFRALSATHRCIATIRYHIGFGLWNIILIAGECGRQTKERQLSMSGEK